IGSSGNVGSIGLSRTLSSSAATASSKTKNGPVSSATATANIALIGAGWWSQGWHLPHLDRNEKVKISAIVDSSPHPKSNLNPHLEPLSALASKYQCPIYSSVADLLDDPAIGPTVDGAIVCTPHSTHFAIGKELIREGRRRFREAKGAMGKNEVMGTNGEREMSQSFRPMNILMEKPMTTSVTQARKLHQLLLECRNDDDDLDHDDKEWNLGEYGTTASKTGNNTNGKELSEVVSSSPSSSTTTQTLHNDRSGNHIGGGMGCFLINHSANYRPQAKAAHSLIRSGKLGTIRHVSAFFASPLSWIFDDPSNTGWNQIPPDDDEGEMVGNGFAWGQSSHLLAWIYHVSSGRGAGEDLVPDRVYCSMTTSEKTGADVSHAATVHCTNGATFSLSGTSLLPGNAHSDPPVGKRVKIKIFGTKGALFYSGDDRDVESGRLEWLRGDDDGDGSGVGTVEIQCPELGFQFEDLDQEGIGPESLQMFIDSCLGRDFYVGADSLVGLRSVQTIDAMYRSHLSENCENVR
ncbi:hypothetical protein ACHAXS_011121, partial [Conticribra weissflogii]